MLVLTRRAEEKIVIDGMIYVTIVEIGRDRVRLGVTAPESVRVVRWEVHERRRAEAAGNPLPSVPSAPKGESSVRTAQEGDHVQVHYRKCLQDGSVASSRGHAPLEVSIGTADPRLPGLGLALVGLAAGEAATLRVPAEQAYGVADPTRVRRLRRTCFPPESPVRVGELVRIADRKGRHRLVRILEATRKSVLVNTNHRWAGQTLELQVEVVSIRDPDAGEACPQP